MVKLRKISAGPYAVWSVGTDYSPYIYVPKTHIPIRTTVDTWENQRWTPFVGFSSLLLPTDRPRWSNDIGSQSQPRDTFTLPSEGWAWEHPWMVDTINHQQFDKEGWQYAVNFPTSFQPKVFPTAYVRRRKWVRARRYASVNRWNKVRHPPEFPLVDVVVGGVDMPGQPEGYQSVWSLTAGGKAMYRTNVSRINPEGDSWILLESPSDAEFNRLSCAVSSGQLWGCSWDGRLFSRIEITKDTPTGSGWSEVKRPRDEFRVISVGLGKNVCWVVTVDGKLWFANLSENNITVADWTQMTNEMSSITVGWNEQVFAVEMVDSTICFRSDVTSSELTGHEWVTICREIDFEAKKYDDQSSMPSLSEFNSGSWTTSTDDPFQSVSQRAKSLVGDVKGLANRQLSKLSDRLSHVDQLHRRSGLLGAKKFLRSSFAVGSSMDNISRSVFYTQADEEISSASLSAMSLKRTAENSSDETEVDPDTHQIAQPSTEDVIIEAQLSDNSTDERCVDATDAEQDALSATFYQDEAELHSDTSQWPQVSPGACMSLTADQLQRLFCSRQDLISRLKRSWSLKDPSANWRLKIIDRLTERCQAVKDFIVTRPHYEIVVDSSNWIKTTSVKVYLETKKKWLEALLELELSNTKYSDGKLTVFFPKINIATLEVPLLQMKFILAQMEFGQAVLNIQLNHRIQRGMEPWKIAFRSEEDQISWFSALQSAMLKIDVNMSSLTNAKSPTFSHGCVGSVWAVFGDGQVYTGDISNCCAELHDCQWSKFEGHLVTVESHPQGITWGLGTNGSAWAFTNPQGQLKWSRTQTDVVVEKVYEYQRWSTFRGFISYSSKLQGLYYGWSDETGLKQKTKEGCRLPNVNWRWLDDWTVDLSCPCDPDGWQLAKSPKSVYTAPNSKTKSYRFRRRCWLRRCEYRCNTTPWLQVDSPPLENLSLSDSSPLVWAVTKQGGNVLCRTGVTVENPIGDSWQHILTPCEMAHVCATGTNVVWAVGADGSAFIRNCANADDILHCSWTQIPPPTNKQLKMITGGSHMVWALDTDGNTYWRRGVSSRTPEGNDWVWLSDNCQSISSTSGVGDLWAICQSADNRQGVIARRVSIGDRIQHGTGWIYALDNCKYLSAVGLNVISTSTENIQKQSDFIWELGDSNVVVV